MEWNSLSCLHSQPFNITFHTMPHLVDTFEFQFVNHGDENVRCDEHSDGGAH